MVFLKVLQAFQQQQNELRFLILGLDNAGKTTIVNRLCGEPVDQVAPTLGFRIKTLEFDRCRLNLWDVGGQKSIRPFWTNYFEKTNGLVWVVDSADMARLRLCEMELKRLLKEERLSGAGLLVLANKTDLSGSLNKADLAKNLDLHSIKSHHWRIESCSALKSSEGLEQGIDWLIQEAKLHI